MLTKWSCGCIGFRMVVNDVPMAILIDNCDKDPYEAGDLSLFVRDMREMRSCSMTREEREAATKEERDELVEKSFETLDEQNSQVYIKILRDLIADGYRFRSIRNMLNA